MRADFEADVAGSAPAPRPIAKGFAPYRLQTPVTEDVFVSEVAPLEGAQSLCIGGGDGPREVRLEVPGGEEAAPNTRPLRLEFLWRLVGFGEVVLDWQVSGESMRRYRMVVARAKYEDAEPEKVGGFFAPELDQPLFLFENGGAYRAVLTVDPVEREPFDGLRQSRIVVTEIGTPGDPGTAEILYDSYTFFPAPDGLPPDYTGQVLTITTRQADPGVWPCIVSALTIDAISMGRDD